MKCIKCKCEIDPAKTFGRNVCLDCQAEAEPTIEQSIEMLEANRDRGWDNLAPRQREKNHWA